ncbi:3D domain-containing protein [Vagococcus elongatus]
MLFLGVIPVSASAESVSELKSKESAAKESAEQIDAEINTVVAEINGKYEELAKLEDKLNTSMTTIQATEKEIEEIKISIDKRKDLAAERLQELQLDSSATGSLQAVLEAESVSDFITRMFAMRVLQNAGNSKVKSLYEDQERLEALEETLVSTQQELEEQQVAVSLEKERLDVQVAGLKEKFNANAASLQQLIAERTQKEETQRAQEAQKKVEMQQVAVNKNPQNAEGSSSSSTTGATGSNQAPSGGVTEVPPAPEQNVPQENTGAASQGQATAYTATGNKTATGTVPAPFRTIAVDPSVIPLGSLVRIDVPSMPQYSGVYRAEDTGGAVRGNIIDIFMGSDQEANNFGRRTIYFSIL